MHLFALLLNPALISTIVLFLSAIWMLANPEDKTRPWLVFALVLNLSYGFLFNIFMKQANSLLPWKFDFVLFRMDQSLGLRAAVVAGPLQELRIPLWIVYQAMVPMMICWFLLTRYRNHRGSVILAYAAELACGPLMYAALPACGPIYAFGAQWLHPPAAIPATAIRLSGIPNAFPSLHAATALVLVFFSPGKFWRAVALLFFAATCLATLSTGEHYVIDLVPGFAFGAFAASVGFSKFRRAFAFLGLVCCWSFTIRLAHSFLIHNPIATRIGAILTVLVVSITLIREWTAHWNAPLASFSALSDNTVTTPTANLPNLPA